VLPWIIMERRLALMCAVSVVLGWCVASRASAQSPSPLGGIWSLNRTLSELPREIGFDIVLPDVGDKEGQDAGSTGGSGRRGSRGGSSRTSSSNPRRESYQDGQRMRILVGEVREPTARLTIVDTPSAVTITNELGQSRVLHPTGREESIEVENIPIAVTTRRDGDRLIVRYHVEQDRDVLWTYSPSANPSRLAIEAQLFEREKGGDKATRVYDSGLATVASSAPKAAPSPAEGSGQQPPSTPGQARENFDQRPGAEFAGLKTLGILVEDLGPEARACGLRQDAIEDALAKRLTAGGLSVRKNSDEDTYVYVNVITTSVGNGTCVSRYDAFLYTHATSKVAYHDRPVLVQVSLLHRGGIGASAPAAHSASVLRGLEGYVDLFVTQIRDANK
jgi:hypothetical protein